MKSFIWDKYGLWKFFMGWKQPLEVLNRVNMGNGSSPRDSIYAFKLLPMVKVGLWKYLQWLRMGLVSKRCWRKILKVRKGVEAQIIYHLRWCNNATGILKVTNISFYETTGNFMKNSAEFLKRNFIYTSATKQQATI